MSEATTRILPGIDDQSTNSPAHARACGDLIASLKLGCFMGDEHAFALLDAEETLEGRKALAVGLKCAGLISEEQCEAAFGLWPMRAAE